MNQFSSLLTHIVTTPHEFILTGDFNVHVDDLSDSQATNFSNLLASSNLTQHVSFPTHKEGHTLDLLITSSSSNINPSFSHSTLTTSDHFPIFTSFNLPTPPTILPTTFTYGQINATHLSAFLSDLNTSRLITAPPTTLP